MVLCRFTCFLLFLDGSLRVDANISIKKSESSPLGTKTEIKNITGFKFLAKAIGTMSMNINEAIGTMSMNINEAIVQCQ